MENDIANSIFIGPFLHFRKALVGQPQKISLLRRQAACYQAIGNKSSVEKIESLINELMENQKKNRRSSLQYALVQVFSNCRCPAHRRQFTGQQKVEIVKRHLIDGVGVSQLCEKYHKSTVRREVKLRIN